MNRIEQGIKNPQQVVWWPLIPVEMRRSLSSSRFLGFSSASVEETDNGWSSACHVKLYSLRTNKFVFVVLVDGRVPIKEEGLCVCWTICVDTNMTMKGAGNLEKKCQNPKKDYEKFPHNANMSFTSCHVNFDICTELRSSNNENDGAGGGQKRRKYKNGGGGDSDGQ